MCFSLRQNSSSKESAITSSRRLFQSLGPAEVNERSPIVTRRDGRKMSWLARQQCVSVAHSDSLYTKASCLFTCSYLTNQNFDKYVTCDCTFTIVKRLLFCQKFPQKDAKTVNVIFDRSGHSGIRKSLWCHISNCSWSISLFCLGFSLLLPFCQPKVTYLQQSNKLYTR